MRTTTGLTQLHVSISTYSATRLIIVTVLRKLEFIVTADIIAIDRVNPSANAKNRLRPRSLKPPPKRSNKKKST